MDRSLHEAIEQTTRAIEVATIVGAWDDAVRLAERLAVYCELAARAEVAPEA